MLDPSSYHGRREAELARNAEAVAETPPAPELPDGEYAIVEVLGHRTYVGRVTEVERFSTKLMSIEPLYDGALLAPILIGGGSLYQFTPCSKEVAAARCPKSIWDLPTSIRATLPAAMLPAPAYPNRPSFDFLDDEEG